jgi:hypothetical protein
MKKVAQQEISTIQKKNAILAQYQVKVSKVKGSTRKAVVALLGNFAGFQVNYWQEIRLLPQLFSIYNCLYSQRAPMQSPCSGAGWAADQTMSQKDHQCNRSTWPAARTRRVLLQLKGSTRPSCRCPCMRHSCPAALARACSGTNIY